MKKIKVWMVMVLLLLLPMPFVWGRCGDRCFHGYMMCLNPLFGMGILFLLGSFLFQSRFRILPKAFGSALFLYSYFWMTLLLCSTQTAKIHFWQVWKLPMWISFIGAVGTAVCVFFGEVKRIS